MKGKVRLKILFLILFIFSFLFVLFISTETTTIADTSPTTKITWNPGVVFDDGIKKWSYQSNNQVGNLKISNNLQLGYAFGLAANTSKKVTTGGDDQIATDSFFSGQNTYYSKINTFLNDNGNYISALFQSGITSSSTASQYVSASSPDFMLVPSKTSSNISAPKYSILSNFLSGKKYYVESDASKKNLAYKVAGDFIRNDSSGNYNLQMEIVLRPSPSNAAIVQRELYIKNNTQTEQDFGILYAEDTQLDGNDRIPIYSLGNNSGIFIQNYAYKLLFDRSLPDGPSNYVVSSYDSSSMDWTKGFTPANFSGNGTESKNLNYGDKIISGAIDTSYTMKWPYTTLKPGATAHYVSSVGVSQPKYAIPKVTKTYTNKTSTDGKNRIGDKLNFDLKIANIGYNSNWSFTKLVDKIPDGLQIDPNSLVLKNPDGTTTPLPAENYDTSSKTLTIPPALTVPDGKSASILFDTTILSNAGGTTVHNIGTFSGIDTGSDDTEERNYTATVDIPVEKLAFDYTFTKQVRNLTNGEATYSDSTNAKPGDIVEFKTKFMVNPASANSLNENSYIYEVLPRGLIGEMGRPVKTEYTNSALNGQTSFKDTQNMSAWIQKIDPGNSVTMVFPAIVTQPSSGTLSSTTKITPVNTSGGSSLGTLYTNVADVVVQDMNTSGFRQTPSLIDFGQINYGAESRLLTNVSTVGQLLVEHSAATNYKISVAYDNDNEDTKLKNEAGDTLPSSKDGLLFIKQRESNPTDAGTWKPITPSGTPIQSAFFNSPSPNLTDYVGVGDWQLAIDSQAKPGKYTGTLTWTIEDAMS
ncbi:ABC transporter permease [Companilactobacillus jidongensis]|uniref:hypothetical protein n=1 Tax=Companilactobacillus jidongensis TaxID=2486006 RepID=UPI000F7A5707|nr:hypothetical protein [Companilactobacillus jidongensis]